jgi:NAD(P)H-quinone oxidoreductase subunit 5
MHLLSEALLATIPLLLLLAGICCGRFSPQVAARIAIGAAAVATASALGLAGLLVAGEPFIARYSWSDSSPFGVIALKLDVVSAVMVVLVSFLGFIVLRFSRNYLAGDPQQSRFFSWMSLTLASVLTLVLSSHLLLLWSAWFATSLCLHRLLLHYPRRAGAVFSARKKFVFSRIGDLSLLGAVLVLYHHHDTWDLDTLFASVAAGQTDGVQLAAFLLVFCAALKSAQFPFHSWLPDTMETPTPVSAFMHAGIINAGGFLIVRFSPLFAHAPNALNLLVIFGTVTAAYGAIVMLAQSSVKRALAYSTIAQMGFMLLQCGLGAYGLALLHIVAHALYKAHAFLHAGSTVGAVPRAAIPLPTATLSLGVLAGLLLVTGGATALHFFLPLMSPHSAIFVLVLALAVGYGLARTWSAGCGVNLTLWSGAIAVGIVLLSLSLHAGAGMILKPMSTPPSPLPLLIFVGLVFSTLFLFQALLWRMGHHPLGRRFYVHALNGFYVGTAANRLLGLLWPRHPIT